MSAWGPNPEWGSRNGRRPPPDPVSRRGDGEEPSCMAVVAPVGVVVGTLIAWMLRH